MLRFAQHDSRVRLGSGGGVDNGGVEAMGEGAAVVAEECHVEDGEDVAALGIAFVNAGAHGDLFVRRGDGEMTRGGLRVNPGTEGDVRHENGVGACWNDGGMQGCFRSAEDIEGVADVVDKEIAGFAAEVAAEGFEGNSAQV